MDAEKKRLQVQSNENKVLDTTEKAISLSEIEKHNTEENGWIVLDGSVYDVSTYDHPGGKDVF